jgi:hypothetical protein
LYYGVGGTEHKAFFHLIDVGILEVSTEKVLHKFKIEAGFSDGLDSRGTGILGIHGFFSQFQVTFLRKEIDILPF